MKNSTIVTLIFQSFFNETLDHLNLLCLSLNCESIDIKLKEKLLKQVLLYEVLTFVCHICQKCFFPVWVQQNINIDQSNDLANRSLDWSILQFYYSCTRYT